jgi:mRNA deadenylase 3'-5' endonuclease subunit Ccr4
MILSDFMHIKKDLLVKSEIEYFIEDDDLAIAKTKSSFRVATYNILSYRLYAPAGKNYNPEKDSKLSWNLKKTLLSNRLRN